MTQHDDAQRQPPNLVNIRQRLAGKKGKEYWRSLSELAESQEFEELVRQEYPRQAKLLDILSRRDFIKLFGAALAMGGLSACMPTTTEQIMPYVNPPQKVLPAQVLFYASTMVQDGIGKGVLVRTTMGRPIKVDGNPSHPDNQGKSDVFMQGSLLELYDPERLQQVLQGGAAKTWQDFVAALGPIISGLGQGAGLRILTGSITSPSLADHINALLTQYPQAKWVQFSATGRANTLAGANQAFGRPLEPVYDFTKAKVILSLDSDFMFTEPGHIRYSHDFAVRHQPLSPDGAMNRLYMVEGSATMTGASADHRLAVKPSQVEAFARALAGKLGVSAGAAPANVPGQSWLDALAADLKGAGPAALVLAGERQPAAVHALAHAMNQALGSVGSTVTLIDPLAASAGNAASTLRQLVDDLNGGGVDTLVILDENPVYKAPADIDFKSAIKKAKQSIYLGYYADETAAQATWVIPAAHYMEMWGDARAYDGTVSLIQPVINPLYGGKSPHELLAALTGNANAKDYDLVRAYWQGQIKGGNFDQTWADALSKGIFPNTASQPATGVSGVNVAALGTATPAAAGGMEIVFQPDYTVWDGRFSNITWLQELPKPLTKLDWDNTAILSPATASRSGVANGDLVDLKLRNRTVRAPVTVLPGQPDDVVTVSLGYGRTAGGTVLQGLGFNAYSIRTEAAPWFDQGVEVSKTGNTYPLAYVRAESSEHGRNLVKSATLDEYNSQKNFAQVGEVEKPPTLYGEDVYNTYAWSMTVNLNTCIGCNACVIGCQAENNIPSVGKDQVSRGREMLWMRIDRYYKGNADQPTTYFEPVPCMQCEKAPCEPVCPVEATSHSAEGINEMTYNRCVGTRYCSNNCPYKVRRFNFYLYNNQTIESLKAMRNPDVTVRMRGVMEKCTYCVQRITHARIQSEVEGRRIQDGEVKTACQEACPTDAITFGDKNDPNSAVRKLKDTPLNYGLLSELGTRPRTTYLAKVRNPNPAIKENQG